MVLINSLFQNSSVVLPEGRRIPIDSKRDAVRQAREVLEKTDDEETDADAAAEVVDVDADEADEAYLREMEEAYE